jgi:hypothetical protein
VRKGVCGFGVVMVAIIISAQAASKRYCIVNNYLESTDICYRFKGSYVWARQKGHKLKQGGNCPIMQRRCQTSMGVGYYEYLAS